MFRVSPPGGLSRGVSGVKRKKENLVRWVSPPDRANCFGHLLRVGSCGVFRDAPKLLQQSSFKRMS